MYNIIKNINLIEYNWIKIWVIILYIIWVIQHAHIIQQQTGFFFILKYLDIFLLFFL